MKYNCSSLSCKNTVDSDDRLCKQCSKQFEDRILRSLENYIAEHYLFKEAYNAFSPFKIVEHQRLKNGIRITGYSAKFLYMFYNTENLDNSVDSINKNLLSLKTEHAELYDALKYLWGKPLEEYKCHKSTVYRRMQKALKFIALNLGLIAEPR